MRAYHIYPDNIMKDLPGYRSEEAPIILLPEPMYEKITSALEEAFLYCRTQGATHLTLEDIYKLMAASMIHAGLSREKMKTILDSATAWFVNSPHDWLTTVNPETGRIWLASLRIP